MRRTSIQWIHSMEIWRTCHHIMWSASILFIYFLDKYHNALIVFQLLKSTSVVPYLRTWLYWQLYSTEEWLIQGCVGRFSFYNTSRTAVVSQCCRIRGQTCYIWFQQIAVDYVPGCLCCSWWWAQTFNT